MNLHIYFAALITATLAGCATPVGPSTSTYEIFSFTGKSGKVVYGLQCRGGGMMCNYEWKSLCTQGKTMDSDPDGNVIDSPGYGRDRQNRPFRMFVCQQ